MSLTTFAKRAGAILLGWVRDRPPDPAVQHHPTPEELEEAYRKYPQTKDTLERPTAKPE